MVSKYFKAFSETLKQQKLISKYSFAFLSFMVWITFFDTNSFITQMRLSSTISALEEEKDGYEEDLQFALKQKNELENNKEKFAREKYLFHKQDEELIIIENQEDK